MRNFEINGLPDLAPITNGVLSSRVEDTLQKSYALNSIIASGKMQLGSKHKGLSTALKGLEFSEGLCESVEKNELEFADTINSPLIGNWTFASLNLFIQEVGSNQDAYTALSIAFPDVNVPEYQVMLDRISPNTGIAAEIGGDANPLPMVKPLNTRAITYASGLWGGKTSLTAQHIFFDRKRGTAGFNERGLGQLLAYNTVNLTVQTLVRKKQLINDAIFNNGYVWGGSTISSNIPSENYIALDSMGTLGVDGRVTYTNPDPYYNPVIAITDLLANPLFFKYQKYIRGVVMNILDLRAIMNHPAVQTTTNAWSTVSSSLSTRPMEMQINGITREVAAWYAPSFNIPFIADDGVWEGQNLDGTADNDSQQFFVPRGKMYVLMDYASFGGVNGRFHLTYNQYDPNVESPSMGLFLGVFPRNQYNSDVSNRLDIVGTLAGAPGVYMPEAQFIFTNLYSNV